MLHFVAVFWSAVRKDNSFLKCGALDKTGRSIGRCANPPAMIEESLARRFTAWSLSILLWSVPASGFAQSAYELSKTPALPSGAAGITGSWIGILGHPSDPISQEWRYQLNITNQSAAGAITGTTTATAIAQPQYFVTWAISGWLSGNTLTFQNKTILQQNSAPGVGWCVDSVELALLPDGETLSGILWATGCGTGTATVVRTPACN